MRFCRLIFLIFCTVLTSNLYAQPATTPVESDPGILSVVEPPSPEEQLRTLLDTIKKVETERIALNRQLKRTADATEAKQLNNQIEQTTSRLKELQASFEELATGSLRSELQRQTDAAFNWQQELEDVLRPLLNELKRLTERPRIIERLRSERSLYQNRIQSTDAAIAHIEETLTAIKDPVVIKALKATLEQRQNDKEDLSGRLQRTNIQFERLTVRDQESDQRLAVTLQEFASGRGLSLALAIGGFALTYLVLIGLSWLVGRVAHRGYEPGTRRMTRVIALCFRLLTLVLALFVAALVLYVRGDWLLLGLLILLVIGLLWGLRQSLPGYMREIRVLLNMGSVREGERVLYYGIPWKIASLNLYSTLYNPLLRGGTLRVPLDKMVDLQSRPYTSDEPWFPSQENDIVMLDGDIYAKVLLQTPEFVQLQIIGATTTFTIADYLGSHPRNLSQEGFAVPIVFGLDYGHQQKILADIVPNLRIYLADQLKEQPFHPYMTNLLVEFNEAASSSLNLLIVAVFSGAGAEYYWSIRRFLQYAMVNACNQYGWTIPFNQLTVHFPSAPPPPLPLPFLKT